MKVDEVRDRATLTVPEAARLLGVGRDVAYRAAETGEIPTLKIGRRIVVPVPRLLAMLGAEPTLSTEEVPARSDNSSGDLTSDLVGLPVAASLAQEAVELR